MEIKKRYLIFASVSIACALYLLTNCEDKRDAFVGKQQSAPRPALDFNIGSNSTSPELKEAVFGKNRPGGASEDYSRKPLELQALNMMTNLLAQALQPGVTLDRIIEILRDHNQTPAINRNSNEDTGTLIIVRTNSPYRGTRYFHAQYFNEVSGAFFVQHMSFEFRPGPSAMKEAVEAVKVNFPGLGDPIEFSNDVITWKVNRDYVIQVSRLNKEDIEAGDPYNSYDAADVGTVWVALQLDEGGHDHDDEAESDAHEHGAEAAAD